MELTSKIFVAGHTGLVGSALIRKLTHAGYTNLIVRSIEQLDLRNQHAVNNFFWQERPEYVFLAAAKVGGIRANSENKASFIYDNLMIQTNVIHAAYSHKIKKLLFLGSSCIYPRNCPQPIQEEYLMTGQLEKTNDAYAIAKIAGISLCQAYNTTYKTCFICCMPTNLYGPNDNFDVHSAHVIPALIAKIMYAKKNNIPQVVIWGDGTPLREFLFVDDLADALLFLMANYHDNEIINVGTGNDSSIAEVAHIIKKICGYKGSFVFDKNQPNGTQQKLLNCDKLKKLGWQATIPLEDGIQKTVAWYYKHYLNQSLKKRDVSDEQIYLL